MAHRAKPVYRLFAADAPASFACSRSKKFGISLHLEAGDGEAGQTGSQKTLYKADVNRPRNRS
jgi:hypothetical protein